MIGIRKLHKNYHMSIVFHVLDCIAFVLNVCSIMKYAHFGFLTSGGQRGFNNDTITSTKIEFMVDSTAYLCNSGHYSVIGSDAYRSILCPCHVFTMIYYSINI